MPFPQEPGTVGQGFHRGLGGGLGDHKRTLDWS
jgi:hypothetical protein